MQQYSYYAHSPHARRSWQNPPTSGCRSHGWSFQKGLHNHPRLTVQVFQVICQLLEPTARYTEKGFATAFRKGRRTNTMLFPLETSIPATLCILYRSSSWICLLATNIFSTTYPIYLMTRVHQCGWLNLHKSNAATRGWLTDCVADANGPWR